MSAFTTIATCSPYLPGYGFRAELQTDGRRYRLVSWDAEPPREREIPNGASEMYGPTVRAESPIVSPRPSDMSDPEFAAALCSLWATEIESNWLDWASDYLISASDWE